MTGVSERGRAVGSRSRRTWRRRLGSGAVLVALVAGGATACTDGGSGGQQRQSPGGPTRNAAAAPASVSSPAADAEARVAKAEAALAALPAVPAGGHPARKLPEVTPEIDPDQDVCDLEHQPIRVDSTAPPQPGTITIWMDNDKRPEPKGLSIGIQTFEVATCVPVALLISTHIDLALPIERGYDHLHMRVSPTVVFRCFTPQLALEVWVGPDSPDEAAQDCMVVDDVSDLGPLKRWAIMTPLDAMATYGRCVNCDFHGTTLRDLDLRGPAEEQMLPGLPISEQDLDDDVYEDPTVYDFAVYQRGVAMSDFRGATLINVDLSHTKIVDTNFAGATIIDSTFEGAFMMRVDLHSGDGATTQIARTMMPSIMSDVDLDGTLLGDVGVSPEPQPKFERRRAGLYGCTSFRDTVATSGFGIDPNTMRTYTEGLTLDGQPPKPCVRPWEGAVVSFADLQASAKGSGPSGTTGGSAITDADGADLSGTTVLVTNEDRTVLAGKDLSGARLSEIALVGARPDLTLTKLHGAHLEGVDLSHVRFAPVLPPKDPQAGPDLGGLVATKARFDGAILAGASLEGAQLAGARFDGADLRNARFDGAHLSDATSKASLPDAFALGASFSNVIANGVDFTGALLGGPDGQAVTFAGSELAGAVFEDARIAGGIFDGPMSGARFGGASCIDCTFDGAKLDKADFEQAYLAGSDFEKVETWDQTRLGGALLSERDGTFAFSMPNFAGALSRTYGRTVLPVQGTATNLATCPDRSAPDGSICENHRAAARPGPYPPPCRPIGPYRCPARIHTWPVEAGVTAVAGAHSATTSQSVVVGTKGGDPVLGVIDAAGSTFVSLAGQGVEGPTSVAALPDGSYALADPAAHRVWHVSVDNAASEVVVAPFVGDGTSGNAGDGGPAPDAKLAEPRGVWADQTGLVYVADAASKVVRMVDWSGQISTVASDGLVSPTGLGGDRAGNLYIADPGAHRVFLRTVDGKVGPYVGTGSAGAGEACTPRPCTPTSFTASAPTGLVVVDVQSITSTAAADPLTLLFTDAANGTVRAVNAAPVVQAAFAAQLGRPTVIWSNPGSDDIYVVDADAGAVLELTLDG